MTTGEALVARLVAQGIGTYGGSTGTIFVGTKSSIPSRPHVVLVATGGIKPIGIHGAPTKYRRPTVRLVARHTEYLAAEALCSSAIAALTVSNTFLGGDSLEDGGIWFLSVRPLQEPYDIGPEPKTGMAQAAVNFFIERAE
jgi:hypothetical protein